MPRIYPTDWKTQIKIFEAYGCIRKRKEGFHHVLICPGAKRAVLDGYRPFPDHVVRQLLDYYMDIAKVNLQCIIYGDKFSVSTSGNER